MDVDFDAARGTPAFFRFRGGQLRVEVPAGVENNHVLRKTVPLPNGLLRTIAFEVRIAPHPRYWRQGADLLVRVIWTDEQMMNGASIRVPTPWGKVPVVVPRYSKRGDIIRVPGKGLPSPRGRGNLLVELSDTEPPPRSHLGLLD
jgi:DnaJ-class molecular chaperone